MQDNTNDLTEPQVPAEPQTPDEPQAPMEPQTPVEPQAPVTPSVPEKPTEKKPIGLIVLAIVEVVVIFGLIIGLVLALNKEQSKTQCDATVAENNKDDKDKKDNGGDKDTNATTEVEKRDKQRDDDMKRFLAAANQYQANNNGKLPFSAKNTASWSLDENFIRRYIDYTCNSGATPICSGEEFRDPDGYSYVFTNKGIGAYSQVITSSEVDHKIYVVLKSLCGSAENAAKESYGNRDFSFYYRMESGAVRCYDNQ